MSSVIGVIGGSGFYSLTGQTEQQSCQVDTPYDSRPVTLYREEVEGRKIVFLARHGKDHVTPPHQINYRANIWALRERAIASIIAVNIVGGITKKMSPGTIVLPDQIIDYTWGREHTFFDQLDKPDNHVDFTWPYDKTISQALADSAAQHQCKIIKGGVYGCTQGPRLETAAEVSRMKTDGCDIVGMTAMPEAALARELGIPYACIALVVNWAAGINDKAISFSEISSILETGIEELREIVLTATTILH